MGKYCHRNVINTQGAPDLEDGGLGAEQSSGATERMSAPETHTLSVLTHQI